MNGRTPHGPYETADAAFADAAHIHQAYRALGARRGLLDHISEGLLLGTLRAAGVQLGAHDRHIAGWLAESADAWTLQVILGWIERAHGRPVAAASAEAADVVDAEAPQTVPHAVMGHGIGASACGTDRVWESRTRDARAVTCPRCLDAPAGPAGADAPAAPGCPCGCTASFCRCCDPETCTCGPACPVCDRDGGA